MIIGTVVILEENESCDYDLILQSQVVIVGNRVIKNRTGLTGIIQPTPIDFGKSIQENVK
jgi:hypothetical protein